MSSHEAADFIRQYAEDNYPKILKAYGSAYANGWKAGIVRSADIVDKETAGE